MTGVVISFDGGVGLGVVQDRDGREYRFHCVEIADGSRTIDGGTNVEFVVLAKLGEYEAACLKTLSPTD